MPKWTLNDQITIIPRGISRRYRRCSINFGSVSVYLWIIPRRARQNIHIISPAENFPFSLSILLDTKPITHSSLLSNWITRLSLRKFIPKNNIIEYPSIFFKWYLTIFSRFKISRIREYFSTSFPVIDSTIYSLLEVWLGIDQILIPLGNRIFSQGIAILSLYKCINEGQSFLYHILKLVSSHWLRWSLKILPSWSTTSNEIGCYHNQC